MALIKLGGLAQDVRGSLNGSVFSRNRGGAYIRSKVSPVQPVSDFSATSRNIFKAISQRWSTVLTNAQRQGWVAFAATHPFINIFGDSHILSGIAYYQAVNRAVRQTGNDFVDDAPALYDVDNPGAVTMTLTFAAGVPTGLAFTSDGTITSDDRVYIFVTPPLNGAREVQQNDYRLLNPQVGAKYAESDPLLPDYLIRFPDVTLSLDSRIEFRLRYINVITGAQSAPAGATVITAGT